MPIELIREQKLLIKFVIIDNKIVPQKNAGAEFYRAVSMAFNKAALFVNLGVIICQLKHNAPSPKLSQW